MKLDIKYIELKTGFSDNGPAWIGVVSFSKSRRTLYFDGKAFQSLNGNGINGNYFEIESGDEYWISGVKKNQSDRHIYGSGKIFVEKRILNDYLKIINQQNLKEKDYQIIEVSEEIPKARINEFENQKYISESQIDENKRFLNPTEMSIDELDYFIEYYRKCSIDGQHLKSRKYSRNLMNKLILEKDLRIK
ncbi:hypothetical protein ACFO4P_13895 [Epilithonimonas pallida]|uniref:Uncharacterized protein n=1 Tax=Epilithonimonas pallida TaxID=373671 RepID=A0ABY1QX11_9FLAO|nr:hypothetical protein [Epilithonimonas pallida]SMP86244.1 hypothetical protein SAMN05421679_101102 [Epilithonimonas pallida]